MGTTRQIFIQICVTLALMFIMWVVTDLVVTDFNTEHIKFAESIVSMIISFWLMSRWIEKPVQSMGDMEYTVVNEENQDDDMALTYAVHNVVALLHNTDKINHHSIGNSKKAIYEKVNHIIDNPDMYDSTKYKPMSCYSCKHMVEGRGYYCDKLDEEISGIANGIPENCPL